LHQHHPPPTRFFILFGFLYLYYYIIIIFVLKLQLDFSCFKNRNGKNRRSLSTGLLAGLSPAQLLPDPLSTVGRYRNLVFSNDRQKEVIVSYLFITHSK
jgi:hypothetical protein